MQPRTLLLAAVLSACGSNTDASPATQRVDTYTVVNLAPINPMDHPQINTMGKAAFTLILDSRYQGKFFDGSATHDIGSLGGGSAIVRRLDKQERVVGTPSCGINRAAWSISAR